ncbi:metal-dependent hydrolase, partial [Marinobacter nauticus]|uniref:metal-dependent hydrolase n=1 Tax=Marinobacter nauticus TaxID=2743 RepID=UPI001E28B172
VPIHAFVAELLRQDGKLFSGREWMSGMRQLWGQKGMFRQIIPEFVDYFKPDFHPWNHDTEFLLKRYRKRLGFQQH